MNSLIKILARSGLLKGDLNLHLVRGSMVLIFLLFGYQKWFQFEAQTLTETEGLHAAGIPGSDFRRKFEAQTPLGRIGQPNDIAPVAVFLASADSAWITGEDLYVSGGLR